MNKREAIKKTTEFVRNKFNNTEGSHDWWHTYRVWQLAKRIAKEEKVDLFIVEMSALLHDVWDWKFSDKEKAEKETEKYFANMSISSDDTDKIKHIIHNISFKGACAKNNISSLEGKVVQDADRLDAVGAIGISRVFAFGGQRNRSIHDPKIKSKKNMSEKVYTTTKSTSINHFYEKLLLLKDRMHTKTAKKIAKRRHEFMEKFLKEFFAEWEGKQ